MISRYKVVLACLLIGVFSGMVRAKQRTKTSGQSATVEDISPNTPYGAVNGGASTAGLTVALAGDERALYAVSLNAGIWKATPNAPWRQLSRSPALACCIAADPNDPRHLAVGERNGLASRTEWNGAGVWESRDAGERWTYMLDPLTVPGCQSQAVPALAFSPRSTLFVGTAVGIGRKPRGARRFDFSRTPSDVTQITAFAIGPTRVWARTREALLDSADDGVTWTVRPLPVEVPPYRIAFSSRGDAFSLAAFDNRAFLVCKPNPDTIGNRNTLLIYDREQNRWQVQKLSSGDGTGLGGRRFVKSYVLRAKGLQPGIGGQLQLFYGAGQEVHQALGVDSDGAVRWDTPVQTSWAGPPHPTNNIHSDLWDIHIGPDFGPGNACVAWIACDGGVFKAAAPQMPSAPGDALRVQPRRWVAWSDGLHTHHIHTLTVLPGSGMGATRLAYPTSDNDAWFWSPQAGRPASACWTNETDPSFWKNENSLGDVNWSAGDWSNRTMALVVRRTALAVLTSFGGRPPAGADFEDQQVVSLNNDEFYDGPLSLQFIQTLAGEMPKYPLLDAVMLARLPLHVHDARGTLVTAPGPLGQTDPDGAPVLLRTTRFAAGPDANRSQFANWRVEARDLPHGARGVWVSGGHARPTYTLYAIENGTGALYKREGETWKRLDAHTKDGRPFTLLIGGWNGPAFVDPYRPERLFVLTDTGIKVSLDGGGSFTDEPTLTALLTASGKYPLTTGELTGNGRDVVLATRAVPLGTLGHMAFDRDHPDAVVAASPFTGVFYAADGRTWRSLTPLLPHPSSAVSAVGLDGDTVYAATEGRSVTRVRHGDTAPLSTYFAPALTVSRPTTSRERLLATLCDTRQARLAGCRVEIRIWGTDGRRIFAGSGRTDARGRLFTPSRLSAETYSVLLRFAGHTDTAPTEAAFIQSAANGTAK